MKNCNLFGAICAMLQKWGGSFVQSVENEECGGKCTDKGTICRNSRKRAFWKTVVNDETVWKRFEKWGNFAGIMGEMGQIAKCWWWENC